MFKLYRQPRSFQVIKNNQETKNLRIEDVLSGLKIEIPYGPRELQSANFIAEYELILFYTDGSEKSVNLLMQGY